MTEAAMLCHLAATLFMTGLIWFVQVVHYPLMATVGVDVFIDYERLHQRRTGRVVGPAMLIELLTAVWLLVETPRGIPTWVPALGLALLVVIWVSTAAIQVPLHRQLEAGYDAAAVRRLVMTNWLRTVFWSARSVVWLVAMGAMR